MKRLALIAVAGFGVLAAPAWADELTIDAPIRSVVVYPQGAAITREGPAQLPAGNTTLIIDHIPTGIDTSSVRVEGLAGGDAQIQSVTVRSGKTDATNPERDRLIAQIDDLRDQLLMLQDQQTALEAEQEFIGNLIDAGPAGFADLLGGQGAGIDQWQTAWTAIGEGLAEVQSQLRQLQFEQRDIQNQIDDLLDQIANLPTEPPHYEIAIELSAAAATDVVMAVNYRVGDARWTPTYDAMLTTGGTDEEPTITLVRRASIVQNTGEDWTDVAITLSTTRPTGGTAVPVVGEALIGVYDYDTARAGAPAMADEAAPVAGLIAPAPIAQTEAVADFGDFRADYIIPVPVSVESGGGARSVQIATEEAAAHLYVDIAPRLSEQAFLTAAFTIESEAPILAGRVNLFRDEAYVGTGSLAFTNPGEEVRLGFGVDDQVHVTWTLADRSTGERGLLTRIAFDEREYHATIDNGHSRAIEITVTDRVPVSDDERIVVDRLSQTTEPTEEDVDGQRGVLAWTYEYEPGESRTIVNAYSVTWPANLNVYGL